MASVLVGAILAAQFRPSFTAFDAAKASTKAVISNGTTTLVITSGNLDQCGCSIGHSSGKWYFELLNNGSALGGFIGLGNNSKNWQSTSGFAANTTGYLMDCAGRTEFNNSSVSHAGNAVASGEYARCALDIGGGKLWFGDSTGWAGGGDPASGTTPSFSSVAAATWYAAAGYDGNQYGPGSTNVTINVGQAAFNYSAPSGFSAWGGI